MKPSIQNDLVVAVLLNYNQNDYTLKCVDSLLESNYSSLKILLVDNGSTKENLKILTQNLPNDNRVVFKKIINNIGYAQGTNYGLEEANKLNPNYMLILNNDTIIDTEAINSMVKMCKKHDDKAVVTGKVYHYDDPNMIQFIGFKYVNKKLLSFKKVGCDIPDKGQFDTEFELDMIDDIFVLQPISLYRKIGGYSKYLWINGVNVERGLRSVKNGYQLIFDPNAKLWHKGSVSFGGRDKNPKLAFWNIQSILINRYLHLNMFYFSQVYFKTVLEITRSLLKSSYLKIIKKENIHNYAEAKLKGLLYFNKWVFKKNANTGFNPY